MLARPISIYLDSSDYSILSEYEKHGAKEIYVYLKEKVASQKVEIRFSGLSILEAAHTNTEAKKYAVKRAQVMEELCGKKCLAWWYSIVQKEAVSCIRHDDLKNGSVAFQDNGHWFPTIDFNANSFTSELELQLRQMLKENVMGRNARRQLKGRIYRDGHLSPEAKAVVEASAEHSSNELAKLFPISQRFFDERILLRVICKELHPSVLREVIEEAYSSPVLFVDWVFDRYDKEKELTKWLREGGFITALEKVRVEIDALPDWAHQDANLSSLFDKKLRQKMQDTIAAVRERILLSIYSDVVTQNAYRRISARAWRKAVIEGKTKLPTLDLLLEVSREYFCANAALGANRRKLRVSDYGDIMHMAYLPHVDLFRCDGYAANLLKSVEHPHQSKIVGKLATLVDRVESMLS